MQNARFELGVVLHRKKKRVLASEAFNNFKTFLLPITVGATENKADTAQLLFVLWVDLVPVTVAFPQMLMPVNGSGNAWIASQHRHSLAQSHCAPHYFFATFGHENNNIVLQIFLNKFFAARTSELELVASCFDDAYLQTEAYSEKGHLILASMSHGIDHTIDSTGPKASRNQNPIA